jgi:hypothetical protein
LGDLLDLQINIFQLISKLRSCVALPNNLIACFSILC